MMQRFWVSLLLLFLFCFGASSTFVMHTGFAAESAPKQKSSGNTPSGSQNKSTGKKVQSSGSLKKNEPPRLIPADEEAYKRQLTRFESLLTDSQKANIRDNWLRLEDQWKDLQKKYPKGSFHTLAFYQLARCREELASRSVSMSDYSLAAERYGEFAQSFPKNYLAPEALLKQAQLLGGRLKKNAESIKAAQEIVKKYPKSAEAKKAQELIDRLQNTSSQSISKQNLIGANAKNETVACLIEAVWKGEGEDGKVILRCTGEANYQYQLVSANPDKKRPARIYVDFPKAVLGKNTTKDIRLQNAPVRRIQCVESKKGVQVILDVPKIKSYTVNRVQGNKGTIEVDLSTKLYRNAAITSSQVKLSPSHMSLAEQLGLSVQTIMIDPGHGGKDPGASANGIEERKFTLDMSKRIGRLLTAQGFTVLYTRESNVYISLQDRPDIANAKKADLFISIHANANTDSTIQGLETYYLDVATTHSAEKVAARENAVSIKNISDLQFILTDFMLSSKLKESKDLARLVHRGILRSTASAKISISDNGVRSAPFYVLMGAKMPAILIEFGYLTHSGDAAKLQNTVFLDAQARGVVTGIVAYRDKLAKYAPVKNK